MDRGEMGILYPSNSKMLPSNLPRLLLPVLLLLAIALPGLVAAQQEGQAAQEITPQSSSAPSQKAKPWQKRSVSDEAQRPDLWGQAWPEVPAIHGSMPWREGYRALKALRDSPRAEAGDPLGPLLLVFGIIMVLLGLIIAALGLLFIFEPAFFLVYLSFFIVGGLIAISGIIMIAAAVTAMRGD
jgi:hypothetical protein